jgi:hypothetical protein
LGPDTYATASFGGNGNVTECTQDLEVYDGIICNSEVEIKGILAFPEAPQSAEGLGFSYIPWDDELVNSMTAEELEAYTEDEYNWIVLGWHVQGWGLPIVTGHKYKWHLGTRGTDFENIYFGVPTHYQGHHKSIYMVHNYTNYRMGMDVYKDDLIKPNNSIPEDEKFFIGG